MTSATKRKENSISFQINLLYNKIERTRGEQPRVVGLLRGRSEKLGKFSRRTDEEREREREREIRVNGVDEK